MLLNENTIIARRSSRSFRGRKLVPSFIRASGSSFGFYTGLYGTSAVRLGGRVNESRSAQLCAQGD